MMISTIREMPTYLRDLLALERQRRKSNIDYPFGRLYPCLRERTTQSGSASGHYFHQDLVVARKIYERKPELHVDVGSRIDGFVAHVATFRTIEVIDIRPLHVNIQNIRFLQGDMMGALPDRFVSYCDSVSCLHALEHFGLGRYGDPVRFDGHLIGLENLTQMLRPGGRFYFSVPVGPLRIEFNAHRVFSIQYLLDMIKPEFDIASFSFVDDKGNLHDDVFLDTEMIKNNCGCRYGCGIFRSNKENLIQTPWVRAR